MTPKKLQKELVLKYRSLTSGWEVESNFMVF